ncbi:hypothetical protein [Crateriforma conspicua]|uniref:hypothetical protein n=1 Tax=Crateriforma conspicua TaxID=2527996 RepID=UPI00118C515E|nr:hypothetical protein [Crateriforma conspicua]QDV61133.1 hypothetical protein Mal65_02560 [Crateriforma conspicua]
MMVTSAMTYRIAGDFLGPDWFYFASASERHGLNVQQTSCADKLAAGLVLEDNL